MALVNQTLNLEITPGGVPPKLHVTEYDENMQVVAQLFQRGQYYEIPSGTSAKVEGTLAGHPFSADATVDGSNVTFELTKSMTAYAGRAWTKIKLTKDGKPVSTCGFWMECDRAGVEAGDVIGAPGFEEQIKDAVSEEIANLPTTGGQPKPVTSAEEMTDTTTIYLYLGSEDGYEYGYIYVYKDGTWVNTGLYGKGQDGESPEVDVAETAEGVTITVNGDSYTVKNGENGTATDEQVAAWLNAHPEATTTVQDGSITPAKTDFLEVVSAEAITPTLTADGYMTYRTDYIDVSGGRSLYITVTGPIGTGSRNIDLEGSDSNKSVVLSKTRLDAKEISRVKYESDDTGTLMYSIDVPKYGEFSYVRLWIGSIKDADTAYTVRAYYSKEAASAVSDFVRPSHKYDVRLADGSISLKQTDFASYVNPTIMDYTNVQTTGYNTDEHLNQFGSAYSLYFADYLEVNGNHELYIRAANANYSTGFIVKVVCYDADKNTLQDETYTDVVVREARGSSLDGSKVTLDDGREAPAVSTHKITVSEQVKYIRWSGGSIDKSMYDFIIVSQEDIVNLTAVPEKYALSVSDDFKKVVQTCVSSNKEYTGVFIGDSLTNWGGGNDSEDGFLKVVHEKTGMSTKNEGLAGAWWQTGDGQTHCAVNRVDTIVSEGRKYDLYCFLMGTNAGANTDTGETSADPSTMPGAIRYCMETLKTYDPTAKILVCLPPQREEGNANQEKVNEVIKAIAESYSVKTLDVYHHSGIVPNTVVANSNYLSDGLHLSKNGITALGNLLASEIKYLFCL